MYIYLKERVKHAVRFRNKRGFGVHSPFMFNLIMNVIRDREKRYSYPEPEGRKIKNKTRKFLHLIYRLACYLNVKSVACVSEKNENMLLYLSALPSKVEIIEGMQGNIAGADFVYIGGDARNLLEKETLRFVEMCNHGSRCVVITDIYKNDFNARLWKLLKEKANVNVDMMWYGVLFFNEKLQKGKYHLII